MFSKPVQMNPTKYPVHCEKLAGHADVQGLFNFQPGNLLTPAEFELEESCYPHV